MILVYAPSLSMVLGRDNVHRYWTLTVLKIQIEENMKQSSFPFMGGA